ncbi:MAG TPA: hypothetical protein VJH21_01690 [Candidatus Paceibacterota bacterium]
MVDLTLFLAQVMGVYLVVVGLSLMLYPKRTSRAIHEVADDYLMPYLGGAVALIVGLLVVLSHNVWDDLTTSLVSLMGWAALVKGALMFLLPHNSFSDLAKKFSTGNACVTWGAITTAIGFYLVYIGFFA